MHLAGLELSMDLFGFGFNRFGQISPSTKVDNGAGREDSQVKLLTPIIVESMCCSCNGESLNAKYKKQKQRTASAGGSIHIRASWSQRAILHARGDRQVCLSGFGLGSSDNQGCKGCLPESRGCLDTLIGERCLILAFSDRVECWSSAERTLVWSMEQNTSDHTGLSVTLPLVPGGYIASKPPFFCPLSPQLRAVSLVLGTEHAILLSASGTIYTWGSGSHGQLGHGSLGAEEEPRPVEALWGVPMSRVAAGGWHSACISAGGDLYVWGWNESGQLGLPSRGLAQEQQKTEQDAGLPRNEQGESSKDVFISIQAFPALVDIPQVSEISKVSCGSRHTAAITSTGDLYTWGWGHYGQLGHGTECSSDEPVLVDFFSSRGLRVEDVVCGLWNTFVSVVQREESPPHPDANITLTSAVTVDH